MQDTISPPKRQRPVLAVAPDGIPDALRADPRWVLWRLAARKEGEAPTKLPYQLSGSLANASKAATWSTYGDTLAAYQRAPNRWSGIGRMFATGAGEVGIDLDDCRDPDTGIIESWAQEIIDAAHTYAEISPSGTGIKLWGRGELPTDKTGGKRSYHDGAVEMYQRGRYFCVTGHHLPGTPATIEVCQSVVDRLWSELFAPRRTTPKPSRNGHHRREAPVIDRARKYVATIPGADGTGGNGGHDQTFAVACKLVLGFGLPVDEAMPLMLEYNQRCTPEWSEHELRHKLDGADAESGKRGYLRDARQHNLTGKPQIQNWTAVEVEDEEAEPDEDGKKPSKTIIAPLTMMEVLLRIKAATDDWPRRVGTWLFSHKRENEINWHDKVSSTFAFLGACSGVIRWKKGVGMVSKEEAHEGLKMEATKYDAVEVLPHWPPIERIYYACESPTRGDGETLRRLLDRFNPSTDIDRDLLLAAIVTPGWGGPPGARPAFLITSDAGRGVGKSKNASMVGRVWGCVLDFDQKDDIKTIKERLLSEEGLTKRVALLDNVKTLRFSWGALEGLITNPTISGKRMYAGEGSRPNLLTWFITLNGASLSKDVAQRVVVIKIDRPAYTGDWEGDTNKFIDDNRKAILADVAAFYAQQPEELRRFTRWGAWERDVLARLPEPADAQKVIEERQGQVDVEAEEASVIEDFFAGQLRKFGYDPAADVVFIPTQEAARWLNWATNEKHGVMAASRTIKQLADEGQIKRLKPDPSRTHGRGFRWTGSDCDVVSSVWTDLEKRIAEYTKAQNSKDA